ncbi:MAG: nickel pincer cofactor biosynthesis protein LarB [Bacillota bacterium]|nr:nickel pincer cofactor biosynthesis protein LarB [Bacillota bacterium]
MNEDELRALLRDYKNNGASEEEIISRWSRDNFQDMGFAKIDHNREKRCGFPEVVYCGGKEPQHSAAILKELYKKAQDNILATRCSSEVYDLVKNDIKEAVYHSIPKVLTIYKKKKEEAGSIAVISAGTSDLAVSEEAALTAEIMGNKVTRFYDMGVAGIHRLLAYRQEIDRARVLIVLAGMDGALPSVVGGMFKKPLIAVPTSIGYGANFGGLSALLAMLNSCSSGITVVNIDNGFGAGYAASLINKLK